MFSVVFCLVDVGYIKSEVDVSFDFVINLVDLVAEMFGTRDSVVGIVVEV